MSSGLPGDLAISVNFVPATKSIFAVVYGCNKDQRDKIKTRISIAEDELTHPLLIIGLFVELERERLVDAVDDLMDKFTLRSDILEGRYWNKQLSMESSRIKENLQLCLQSHHLIDQMSSVKRQLKKLIGSVGEFNRWVDKTGPAEISSPLVDQEDRDHLAQIGAKISMRVQDIIDEYNDKMDECKTIEESLSLAMQTVRSDEITCNGTGFTNGILAQLWNQIAQTDSKTNTQIAQVNTMIALETKGESVQMRSIALLTMIYIPLSCVAVCCPFL